MTEPAPLEPGTERGPFVIDSIATERSDKGRYYWCHCKYCGRRSKRSPRDMASNRTCGCSGNNVKRPPACRSASTADASPSKTCRYAIPAAIGGGSRWSMIRCFGGGGMMMQDEAPKCESCGHLLRTNRCGNCGTDHDVKIAEANQHKEWARVTPDGHLEFVNPDGKVECFVSAGSTLYPRLLRWVQSWMQ